MELPLTNRRISKQLNENYGNMDTSEKLTSLDPDPDNWIWEYDGDGKRIYKEDQGFISKRLYAQNIKIF